MKQHSNQQQRDHALGTDGIARLLLRLSVPATLAMFVHALYNLVDTIFVGRGVGTEAIGGLTIAFPFQILVMAIAMTFGMGTASVVSRSLGAGNRERAYAAAGTAFTLSIGFGLLETALGYLFLDPILTLFGATPGLIPYAREYLSTILPGAIFISFAMSTNNIVRAEGRAAVSMASMILGAVANIILDPIFIFGLKMGIRGAALATVIAQSLSFVFLILYFATGRSSLTVRIRHLNPDWSLIPEILSLGVPAFVRHAGFSVVFILVNNALGRYGGMIYIAAFGLVFRVLHFVMMPIIGLVQGFQPITGYNYGAGSIPRVRQTLKLTLSVATAVAAFGYLLLMVFPGPVFRIFSTDAVLISRGIPVLRVVILILPLLGLQLIGTSYFQAVGKAVPAFVLGLSRQFLFLLPLMIVLPAIFGLWGVFAAFPAADFLSSVVTVVLLGRAVRSLSAPVLRVQPL